MKPAPRKPARPAVKKSTGAPTSGIDPDPKLPTVSRLASMAAIMATPEEPPFDTARRALNLWDSCEGLLLSERILRGYKLIESVEKSGKRDQFLSACGLNPFGVYSGREKGTVRLNKFLGACKPSPNTKPDVMMAKWRAFRRMDIECMDELKGLPQKISAELDAALMEQMKNDRTNGIPVISLCGLWEHFEAFIERDRKANRSKASSQGGRGRKKEKNLETVNRGEIGPRN